MAKIGQVRFFFFILAKTKTSFTGTAQNNVVEEEGSQNFNRRDWKPGHNMAKANYFAMEQSGAVSSGKIGPKFSLG